MFTIFITQRSAHPDHADAFASIWNLGVMAKRNSARSPTPSRLVTTLIVRQRTTPNAPHLARLEAGQITILAAIGRAGMSCRKREGDWATPVGDYSVNPPLYRSDKLSRIRTLSGSSSMKSTMGWCDDPSSFRYNKPVRAGSSCSHERFWRADSIYDVVLSTSHNQNPRIRGAGSAIFLHLAKADYAPTRGCIALSLPDLRRLLPRLGRKVRLVITR
jgi:L,D-peptidoglycan transpeptidase YkuD (ErfK/YbiS/YcfS/YnhG family)